MGISNSMITELTTEDAWLAAFSVMKQLRPHLSEEIFLALMREAAEVGNYKLIALFSEGEIVALCGFMPMITLYNGKSIWVCDLVTDVEQRSKGYGKTLLTYVEHWAKAHQYSIVSLSSGLQRTDAHRFYEQKMEYDKVSYVFLKKLSC